MKIDTEDCIAIYEAASQLVSDLETMLSQRLIICMALRQEYQDNEDKGVIHARRQWKPNVRTPRFLTLLPRKGAPFTIEEPQYIAVPDQAAELEKVDRGDRNREILKNIAHLRDNGQTIIERLQSVETDLHQAIDEDFDPAAVQRGYKKP